MADIHNDYSGAHINFEAGSTQNGDVNITGGTFNQHPLPQEEAKRGAEKNMEHYTQRQLILLFSELMHIPIAQRYFNVKAFSTFLAKVGGGSSGSFRTKINEGIDYESDGVQGDLSKIAEDIMPFSEEFAKKIMRHK